MRILSKHAVVYADKLFENDVGASLCHEEIDRPCSIQSDNLASQPTLGLLMVAEYSIRLLGDAFQAQGAVGFSWRKRLGMFLAARQCAARGNDTIELFTAEPQTAQMIDLVRGDRHRRLLGILLPFAYKCMRNWHMKRGGVREFGLFNGAGLV